MSKPNVRETMSLNALWDAVNERRGRAARWTIEALMFQLRRGVEELKNPSAQQRLSELSDGQLRDVLVRLQKLKPEIAKSWTPEELEILVASIGKIK
jgi:hypothetical protein